MIEDDRDGVLAAMSERIPGSFAAALHHGGLQPEMACEAGQAVGTCPVGSEGVGHRRFGPQFLRARSTAVLLQYRRQNNRAARPRFDVDRRFHVSDQSCQAVAG